MKRRSIVLLSGGLDSSANLAICASRDEPVLALTADYGQRAAAREIETSRMLCEHYQVPHEELSIPWLGALGGSSLTESAREVPVLRLEQLDQLDVVSRTGKSVWVPNRNGVLINIAASYAERLGAEQIVVGFNREEANTFPDNTVDFLHAVTQALAYSTSNHVKVISYTAELDKTEIIQHLKLVDASFPLDRVWSCYLGGARPCRECESCQRYQRAVTGASAK